MRNQSTSSLHFQRKISEFCNVRIAPVASKRALENIRPYLISLIIHRKMPPMRNGRIDWQAVADACGIEDEMTAELKKNLRSGLEAIVRWLGKERPAEDDRPAVERPTTKTKTAAGSAKTMAARPTSSAATAAIEREQTRAKPGAQPRPIEEFPKPLFDWTEEPEGFQQALIYHMRRHGDTYWHLHRAIVREEDAFDHKTLLSWTKGTKVPRSIESLDVLSRIERRYRLMRVHRDPFEPIMCVLEADSPLAEYRKITDEILKRMPDEDRYPRAAAESVRSFLMLRLGLHLGLRQKNLRQMLVCPRGHFPTSERRLEDMKRGEIRWSDRDRGWEVLVPANAFKNANSSFFGSKPFRLVLPDLLDLYKYLNAYIERHRGVLLAGADDPGTLFVKTVKANSRDAAYNQTTFYEAWRLTIQRYGIYNPYTGRGAIKGLLPHGPHNVRDVLATHILKQTGSYEQASYAIQDTAEMVASHYGRFLPQDKAALAAKILNQVWEAA
ncbi:hypothetical protein J2Z31_005228 [Sinorhizobium kostiense]|uniref:Integrase n=1 Tax=Sinorhizobium kostiense TaxID=76747 RepID=A0ABS4R705_9HYPH|nr:hypothetical protein [Sinorhizobium kostiense]MBP2238687.1 hypothetical protein [Sinorhizobium kostiense]